jgi:hypothetical protein
MPVASEQGLGVWWRLSWSHGFLHPLAGPVREVSRKRFFGFVRQDPNSWGALLSRGCWRMCSTNKKRVSLSRDPEVQKIEI